MIKTLLSTFLAIIIGILALLGYLTWSYHYDVSAVRTSFASDIWQDNTNIYADSNDPGCIRGGMAIDLVETKLLRGKTISEVTYLLGDPIEASDQALHYELGQCSGFGWYNTLLSVSVNNNGEVSRASIVWDTP